MKLQSPPPSDRTKVGCSSSTSRSWKWRLHQERFHSFNALWRKNAGSRLFRCFCQPSKYIQEKDTSSEKSAAGGNMVKHSWSKKVFQSGAKLALLGLGMSWHVSPSLSRLGILLSQRTMAQNSPILCPFFLQFPAGGFLSAYHLLPCTARYNTNISWWCWILLLLLLLGVALAACFSECIAGWLGT